MQSIERADFLAASAGRAHRVDNPCFAHRHLLTALNITNCGAYVQTGSRRADKFETCRFRAQKSAPSRTLEGLGSSNPPLSANKSVHLAYILENGRKSARNAAFFQLAAQQREPAHAGFSRFGEHSLCAKQKRFASAPERALGGVRLPTALRGSG